MTIAILCLATLFFVYRSIHWSWQWDTSAMHYVSFFIDHGKAPYRDIVDMNMPGSYFLEGWALRIFGPGDLGWRMYDFFLLAVTTASMIVIAWPYDWLAGLFGGAMFTLIHGAEGAGNAAQREEVMTVLIVAGIAFAFSALRARRPLLMLPFGFLVWLAVSLKPTVAPLGIVLLLMSIPPLRRRKEAVIPYMGFALLGFAAASCIIVGFLLRYHATGDFLSITKRLLPYYAGVGNLGIGRLISLLPPRTAFIPLLLITLILTLRNKDWKNWERQALAVAICFGVVSFVAQRKGFAYHRYPLSAFLLLWMGLEFFRAMKMQGWMRSLGFTGAAGLLLLIPGYCISIYQAKPNVELTDALMQDLNRLGGPKLQNQVQCLDMVSGCLGALYRLGLVHHTGFLGDFMLFGPPGSQPSAYYRNMFLEGAQRNPPGVIVLTTSGLAQPESFEKIAQWPQFVEFLNSNYSLDVTRMFDPINPRGYRIYLLKSGHAALTDARLQR
ncbi:hypothetical protein AB4Y89_10005 [Terriglobus sp. 2YAB30_2]|uniref:hypothetical protein n=1 Tax=Terriglobus sp. 2YAB30_2 TaxID=3233023 RepID=UPI003F9956F8